MTLLITNAEFQKLVSVEDAIEILEPTFADFGSGRVASRPRTMNYTDLGDGRFHLFSCMDSSVPRHGVHLFRMTSDLVVQRGEQGHAKRYKMRNSRGKYCGLVMMFSLDELEPLAIFQDSILNQTMVGATSAIAAKHISRKDSEVMSLLGAGWLARTQVIGHCAVRSIKEIRVFAPTEAHKLDLCRELENRVSARLVPVNSGEEAINGADIIACATNAYTPCFNGADLKPGVHVGSVQIGELDVTTHERARTITSVACDPVTLWGHPSPDTDRIKGHWRNEWDTKLKFLGEIVAGRDQGRTNDDDVTLFGGTGTGPSSGLGLQYVPALLAYQRAKERGMGFEIPTEMFLEDTHP